MTRDERRSDGRPLTKIVATVGPATRTEAQLAALLDAGVDVIRLNFSHGTQAEHAVTIERARRLSAERGRAVALLQDLQGPKLRVGDLVGDDPVRLEPGALMTIVAGGDEFPGTAGRVWTSYERLAEDVAAGDQVLLDDGAMALRVETVRRSDGGAGEVVCRVVDGGLLRPQKGINLPGVALSVPALTAKDEADLAFGVAQGVDLVALSFVRAPEDLRRARAAIRTLGGRQPLIAKIEKPQAAQRLEAIVRASDGIMVARGDLGVELSPEEVPTIQKRAIRLANAQGVPVITATQMLESMMTNPRPTRAEASDVANAILDGTDAVMLSGETAVGQYPIEAVRVMDRISREMEREPAFLAGGGRGRGTLDLAEAAARSEGHAIARAARALARALPATAIVVLTATGRTAGLVSKERPGVPIVAVTARAEVARRLALWHGVLPVVSGVAFAGDPTGLVERVLRENGLAAPGDRLVIVGSIPRAPRGRNVYLQVHRMTA